ncbi:MAG: hypothetical protein AAF960_10270 [Bacteroidota bacterium]
MKLFSFFSKSSLAIFLGMFLLFSFGFQNQGTAQCDYPPGTITLNTAGGTSNPFYTTQYVLVDSLGNISQFQSTASFTNVQQGEYSAYAINYKTSDGINGLTIGQPFSGLTVGPSLNGDPSICLDTSPAFTFSVGAVDANLAVSDATICNPAEGNVDITITNAQNGVVYELQTLAGASFSPAVIGTGAGTDLTLTIPQASAPTTTTTYKVVASLPGCTDTDLTDQAIITVEGPLTIATQPANSTICDLGNTSFSVVADGGVGTLNYQWQESTNGGTSFTNITDGGIYAGATTATLSLAAATDAMDENQYRVLINTGACSATTSNPAILTVEGAIAISVDPTNQTICDLGDASFTVTATNETGKGTFSYQWQESTDGGNSFTNISDGGIYAGATTNTLNLTAATDGMNDNQYRVFVSTGACSADTSVAATLTVEGGISINTQPVDSDICENDNTSFAVVVGNESGAGTISYQWQESTNGGTSFTDIVDGGIYGGATTATLTLTGATIGMNAYQYRLVANTGACSDIISNPATLNVFNLPTATAGNDSNVCDDFGGFDLGTLTTLPTATFGTILWTADNGNGTPSDEGAFDDATTLTPTYTPSEADIIAGSVTLTITVTGTNGSCAGQIATDAMVLTIDICCNATAPTLSGN